MFKKIYEKLDTIYDFIKTSYKNMADTRYDIFREMRQSTDSIKIKFDDLESVVESQQRTIEQLTNAMRDKYEHGLFVLSDDGTNLMVIKNGEEIVNDSVAYCRVTWAPGEAVTLETEYRV